LGFGAGWQKQSCKIKQEMENTMAEPQAIRPSGRSQAERQMEEQMKQVLNTQQMIENDFFKNLEAAGMGAGLAVEASQETQSGNQPPSSLERSLVKLAKLRDDLAESFINVSQDPAMTTWVRNAVKRVEDTIVEMGGYVEPVNELAYMSSLNKVAGDAQAAMLANANRVVENTVKNFKQTAECKIAATKVGLHNGKPTIAIRIEGSDRGYPYLTYGQIVAPQDFSGNEAIDFIRKAGVEMFSVRAVQLGHWRDVTENFEISSASDVPRQAETTKQEPVLPPEN
jgi:hypothetical protein